MAGDQTYTGREYDAESGLYYYRARYYDPTIGRYLNEDPIGFAGGDLNLYAYVLNRPITFIDPSGLISLNWPDLLPFGGGFVCAGIHLSVHFFGAMEPAGKTQRGKRWDWYFHCLANCQVSKNCGIFGALVAGVAGPAKEEIDCHFNPPSCHDGDDEANWWGLTNGNQVDCCEKTCRKFLPE